MAESDNAALRRVVETAGAYYEARSDSWFYSHLPTYRAMLALQELDLGRALAECDEGVRRSRASGDMAAHFASLYMSLHVHRLLGDHGTADELAQQAAFAPQEFDPSLAASGLVQLSLSKWLSGEREAARELAMKARNCWEAMSALDLAHITNARRLWIGTSTEPRFADFERLLRLPPRAGAIALMKGMFDELAMLDSALGREDLAAQFRKAADELNAEFEAAIESA